MPSAAPPPGPHGPRGPNAPRAMQVARAIEANTSLAGLLARVAESKRRFASIVPLLPPALCGDVQPGPVDDTQWSLLASNAAAASKLRQLVPTLQAALTGAGWPDTVIKIKVLPRR